MARSVEGHRARKRFGQHFLADQGVVQQMVDAISLREDQKIIEIGPGLGALTDALLERVETVQAVEIDRDLAARLRRRYPANRLVLFEADALSFDFALALSADTSAGLNASASAGANPSARSNASAATDPSADKRLRVVGNLPYNISSPLLVRLLEYRSIVADQHFMLQKEVVERIVGVPGTSDYGRLSVLLQSFFDCQWLFDVPPTAFDPPPRVRSAVVRMTVRRDRLAEDPAPLQQLLSIAFGQRRKMLRGTLLPWLAQRGVASDGIEPSARAEQIDVDTWRGVAARLAATAGIGIPGGRQPGGPVGCGRVDTADPTCAG